MSFISYSPRKSEPQQTLTTRYLRFGTDGSIYLYSSLPRRPLVRQIILTPNVPYKPSVKRIRKENEKLSAQDKTQRHTVCACVGVSGSASLSERSARSAAGPNWTRLHPRTRCCNSPPYGLDSEQSFTSQKVLGRFSKTWAISCVVAPLMY